MIFMESEKGAKKRFSSNLFLEEKKKDIIFPGNKLTQCLLYGRTEMSSVSKYTTKTFFGTFRKQLIFSQAERNSHFTKA